MEGLLETKFLVISNSYSFSEIIRENLRHYGSIFYCKSLESVQENLNTENFSAVLIDTKIEKTDISQYKLLLLTIFAKNLSTATIIFSQEITQENIVEYYKYGIQNIFFLSELSIFLVPTIKRFLYLIPRAEDLALKDRGISVYVNYNYIIYKGCKIFLTKTEISILRYLLQRDHSCTKEELLFHLSKTTCKKISVSYLIVVISRLRKKVLKHTGINIIKNRNGFGYYISV